MIKKVMAAIAVLILCFATSVYGDVVVDGKDVVGSFDTGGDYTPTGTWDWSTATVTWPTNLATYNGITPSADVQTLLAESSMKDFFANMLSGAFTDGHLVKINTTSGLLEDAGAATTGFSEATTGSLLVKTGATTIGNPALAIDAHAASTTITLYPGICPVIHNQDQAAADINNTLPALAEGLCFIAQVRTAQAANYWRLTAATGNTVCLDGTCAKDYVSFAAPAVANFYTCIAAGTTAWHCESGRGTATTD